MKQKLEYIRLCLDKGEILCQLAEEADELGQAALKLRRAIVGKNPARITRGEALCKFREEIADVLLCLDALEVDIAAQDIEETKQKKAARWAGELYDNEVQDGK